MPPRPSTPETAALQADIVVQSDLWRQHRNARMLVRRALAAAHGAVGDRKRRKTTANAEVAVVLTDDAAIREINKQWRNQDKPTNVLSFPAAPAAARGAAADPIALGDIIIAYETLMREATHEEKAFSHHLSHLVVHGFLHLVGFDHENEAEAVVMEQREREILAELGVPDPYAGSEPAHAIKVTG
jgi:probable rRNA maturation factor